MSEKRPVASLTPYYQDSDGLHFYMQMRDTHVPNYPGRFGLFGGGVEQGETPETAMRREIEEELEFDAQGAIFFCHFEFCDTVHDSFVLRVEPAFERAVTVREGQYGAFLSEQEVRDDLRVTDTGRVILLQMAKWLNAKKH